MNRPCHMEGESYIVDWRQVVGEAFLEEFTRINRALIYGAAAKVMAALTEEQRERYQKARYSMSECGYWVDRWHVPHICGWAEPYLAGDELRFRTTAPAPRRFISMRSFMDFKRERDGQGS